jgi:hypothetical protein
MSVVLTLYLIGGAAAGVVVAGWRSSRVSSNRPRAAALIFMSLMGVLLALLSVGVVSGTMTRHVVQTMPLVIAALLLAIGSRYGVAAAAPLFSFWLDLMLNIWLYLAGWLRLIGGQFTATEIVLTIAIGVLCSVGLVAAGRQMPLLSRAHRLVVAGLFSILQIAAFIASFSVGRH